MKILKVDKDKVQMELTREEVDTIECSLMWNERNYFPAKHAALRKEVQKIQTEMRD